jgi:SAM-dependent methyltransferase
MFMTRIAQADALPGKALDVSKMPGHWLLARLGKRVLRPGGLGITQAILRKLAIGADDDVVEFAPGLGVTARMILDRDPRSYVGVERDAKAAEWTARHLPARAHVSIIVGAADRTGLAAGSASVVLGEAMLSMNTEAQKQRIVTEAFRLLRPGGRYAIHELAVVPDDMPQLWKDMIGDVLSSSIHVGARPLTAREWKALMENAGFRVMKTGHAPMHLLRVRRLIDDEGLAGALRLGWNILFDSPARRRVLAMRRVFEQHREHLGAIFLVAQKP